ncbi:MAG: hypothetical protein HQK54_16605 [Oligoflexales bacterium]|nr:hypothetical protein [Oligoflexales bacterium]
MKQYRIYKKNVFARYNKMSVKLTDIRLFSHVNYAMSIMNQDFNGDNYYKARGRKILYWSRGQDNVWRIKHERFEKRNLDFSTITTEDINKFLQNSPSAKVFLQKNESQY